ncbi:peptidylprolyl isomerase [Candidatus Kuenenia sp.]|uniref:peptidylprolyl isomerase n=1 Tax=Candidatus Kuenenia sp. TaxID=2499824 RepID=UPI00321F6D68
MCKKAVFYLCAVFLLFPAIICFPGGPLLGGDIAAVVNGKNIKKDDVDKRLNMFKDADAETYNAIRQEVIEQLITDILLEDFIDKQGIVVTPMEMNRELMLIKKEIAENEDEADAFLRDMLASIGSNLYDFEKTIKHSLALEKYFKGSLDSQNLKRFFEKNKHFFNGEAVRVSHIFIDTKKFNSGDGSEKVAQLINTLKSELDKGADFEELAREYSDGPSASKGGDLGFIQRRGGTYDEPFLSTAFSLRIGKVSEPVKSEYGYHLIKVTGKREGVAVNFEDVIGDVRSTMLDEEILGLLKRLRSEAKIEIIQ